MRKRAIIVTYQENREYPGSSPGEDYVLEGEWLPKERKLLLIFPVDPHGIIVHCDYPPCLERAKGEPRMGCVHHTLKEDGSGTSGCVFDYVDGGSGSFSWRNRFHYHEALTVLLIGKYCRHQTGLPLYELWKMLAKLVYFAWI